MAKYVEVCTICIRLVSVSLNSLFNFVYLLPSIAAWWGMKCPLYSTKWQRFVCHKINMQMYSTANQKTLPCHLVLEQKRRLSLFKNIEEENIYIRQYMDASSNTGVVIWGVKWEIHGLNYKNLSCVQSSRVYIHVCKNGKKRNIWFFCCCVPFMPGLPCTSWATGLQMLTDFCSQKLGWCVA